MLSHIRSARLIVLAALAGLASLFVVSGCNGCPNSAEAAVINVLQTGLYTACQTKLGPLCGSAPTPVQGDDPSCVPNSEGPGSDVESFKVGGGSAPSCGAAADDTPCQACIKSFCCDETVTCFGDFTCACIEARHTPGVTLPGSKDCGEANDLYARASGCEQDHCAAACQEAM